MKLQHAVFGVCRLIDLVVPDIPESLDVKIKRERYLAKEALQDADHVLQVTSSSKSIGQALLCRAQSAFLPAKICILESLSCQLLDFRSETSLKRISYAKDDYRVLQKVLTDHDSDRGDNSDPEASANASPMTRKRAM